MSLGNKYNDTRIEKKEKKGFTKNFKRRKQFETITFIYQNRLGKSDPFVVLSNADTWVMCTAQFSCPDKILPWDFIC